MARTRSRIRKAEPPVTRAYLRTYFKKTFEQMFEEKFEQKFEQKFREKFEPIERQIDFLARKQVETDARLDNMVTKDEFHTAIRKLTDLIEGIAVVVKNTNEDLVAHNAWMRRAGLTLENHEERLCALEAA